MVLRDCFLSINSVDLSNKVRQVSLPEQVMRQENTTMGATSEDGEKGLLKWKLQVTFKQDFSVGSVDDTLNTIKASATGKAPIEIRPTTAAVGTTNPKRTGTALLVEYDPFGGTQVGNELFVTATFECSGDLTRATA